MNNDTQRKSESLGTDAQATERELIGDALIAQLALQLQIRRAKHALAKSMAREVRQMTIEAVTTCPGCGQPTRTLLPDGNVQDLCEECVKAVDEDAWPEVVFP